VGDCDALPLGGVESLVKYHPLYNWNLTLLSRGQCVVGSLTGVVASKRVTEAFKGTLSMVGNHTESVMAQGCLTERPTSRSGSKDGHSDPVIPHGWVIAQRIKGTPGITG
jgi:hypothetical protein